MQFPKYFVLHTHQHAPLRVVGGLEVKDNGNVRLDVGDVDGERGRGRSRNHNGGEGTGGEGIRGGGGLGWSRHGGGGSEIRSKGMIPYKRVT